MCSRFIEIFLSFRFGFVEFTSPEEATSAYEAMQGQEIDGREVVVDYAAERGEGGGGGGWRGELNINLLIKLRF